MASTIKPIEEINGNIRPTLEITANIETSRLYPIPATLDSLADTDINNPQANQILKYNGIEWVNSYGGGGGVSDYSELSGKPQINNIELSGNRTSEELGLASTQALNEKADKTEIPDISGKADKATTLEGYGITDAIKEPIAEGTSGQVLTTDGNGGRSWTTVSGGGEGGTTNYNDLNNKPSINGIQLVGNKSSSDLGVASKSELPTKTSDLTNDGDGSKPFLTEHQSLDGYAKTEDIPTKVSDLDNDSKFVTEAAIEKLDLTSEAQEDEALVWDSEVQKYIPKKTKGGHDMYKSLSELPKDEDGYIDIPSDDEHVMSAHAVIEVANTKTYRIIVEATPTEQGGTGIGTWCADIDNYTIADSTDWIGARTGEEDISNLLKAHNGDEVKIELLFDPSTNEKIYKGGYQLDLDNGRMCVKFGNTITVNARIGIDLEITTFAN